MVGRTLCNNRAFSCLHCYSMFDRCSSSSLSSAPPALIPINLLSHVQDTLPILILFLRWSCPAVRDGDLRCPGHEVSPQPSFVSCHISGENSHRSALKNWISNAEMSGKTKSWLSHLMFRVRGLVQ